LSAVPTVRSRRLSGINEASGPGVEATTAGTAASALFAHHEGGNVGYGVYATSAVGTGVYGNASNNGVVGISSTAAGTGVAAWNTQGGFALRVNGKAGFGRSGLLTLASSASSRSPGPGCH